MSNTLKGKQGEELAVKYLLNQGYKILERNFRYSRFGEIDIIAMKDSHISFVEVKSRKNSKFGHPLEAISPQKIEKIIMSMRYFLSQTKIPHKTYGIEAISILSDSGTIEHLRKIEF